MTEPFAPTLPEANDRHVAIAWTERLLDARVAADFTAECRRFAVALGLASLFGAALGLRGGGASVVVHAGGVAAGILAVCAVAVPALAIIIALVNVAIDATGLARAASRAAVTAGLVLAGLAPAAALFAVTVEDALSAGLVGAAGLALAGALATRSFVLELAPQIAASDERARRLARIALPLFLVFAAILGARIWWITLPIVRGG